MGTVESDLRALEMGVYKDEFVRKLVAEAGRDRRWLLHTIQDEFGAYFDRMDGAGALIPV